MPKMCRITTAAQSPFVDYNPIDILMGIKKGEGKAEIVRNLILLHWPI
jgi:hypothetical protein